MGAALALLVGAGGCRVRLDQVHAPDRVNAKPADTALEACWIETGRFGPATASAMVVRHPKGDVLIDAGNSRDFEREIEVYPTKQRRRLKRLPGKLHAKVSLADRLAQAGIEAGSMRWFIPTHAHIDHLGGWLDILPVPVLLSAPEAKLVDRAAATVLPEVVPAHAKAVKGHVTEIDFVDQSYEIFSRHGVS